MAELIGDLQKSMKVVFGDITVDALVSAEDTGTFTFTKGAAKNFLYENLSAGEKAAFDLLLDIVVNKAKFDDALYCIDEPEAHLSTKIQRTLLNELCRLIPDNSQLWLATHSIGMVRAAQDMRADDAEKVIFLDVGYGPDGELRDYDQPQTIEPANTDHRFWKRHYVVALDDMAELLAPERIVLCESSTEGEGPPLDEACYSRIFAREFPQTQFVSVGPASKVEKRMGDLLPLLERIIGKTEVIRFRDRDDSTPEEVKEDHTKEVPIRTMSEFRNLESMLLSDGVLARLCESLNKSDRLEAIRAARDEDLKRKSGQHAADDLKPAAQAVHHAARRELKLERSGRTKDSFMRNVLAPLVKEGTPEYQTLRNDIFGHLEDPPPNGQRPRRWRRGRWAVVEGHGETPHGRTCSGTPQKRPKAMEGRNLNPRLHPGVGHRLNRRSRQRSNDDASSSKSLGAGLSRA